MSRGTWRVLSCICPLPRTCCWSAQAATLRCLPACIWVNTFQGCKAPCPTWVSVSYIADICGVVLENKGNRNFLWWHERHLTFHKTILLLKKWAVFLYLIAVPKLHDSKELLIFSWNLACISSTLFIFVLTTSFTSLFSCPVLSSSDAFTGSRHISALFCWTEPNLLFQSLLLKEDLFSQTSWSCPLHAFLLSSQSVLTDQASSSITAHVAAPWVFLSWSGTSFHVSASLHLPAVAWLLDLFLPFFFNFSVFFLFLGCSTANSPVSWPANILKSFNSLFTSKWKSPNWQQKFLCKTPFFAIPTAHHVSLRPFLNFALFPGYPSHLVY